MFRTDHWERRIDGYDPERDARAIVEILLNHVFPVELRLFTELGQVRTATIPSIAKILHATGQYAREGVKRVEDTQAILVEIFRDGAGSDHGREMVEHLNAIHAHYKISNDDYLYTLSVFVVDPYEGIAKYGFRPLRENERDALFHLFRDLGERMKIQGVPSTFDELVAWRRAYERRAQRFALENHEVAASMFDAIAAKLPVATRALVVPVGLILLGSDEAVRAVGYEPPPRVVRSTVERLLRGRRRLLRRVDPWKTRSAADQPIFARYVTYPNGYDPFALGPRKIVANIERRRRADRGAGDHAGR